MEQHPQQREDLRLYLLGILPEGRQRPLEERLLTDATLFEELLIFEDELIDQYLAEELTKHERDAFESYFLKAPDRREQMRFASALRSYVTKKSLITIGASSEARGEAEQRIELKRPNKSFLSWLRVKKPALAFYLAAALLLVSGVSWIAVRSLRTSREPQEVLTVLLTPGGITRGSGDLQPVVITKGIDVVRFQLSIGTDEFQSYRASLLTDEGAKISTAEGLKPQSAEGGYVVVVSVLAREVPHGEYQVRLIGVYADGRSEGLNIYRFRVLGH